MATAIHLTVWAKRNIMIVKQGFRVKIPLMCDPEISETRQPRNERHVSLQTRFCWASCDSVGEPFRQQHQMQEHMYHKFIQRQTNNQHQREPVFSLRWFLSWHGRVCRHTHWDYTVSRRVNIEHESVSSSQVSAGMLRVTGFDLRPAQKALVELALSACSHEQKQIALLPILMKRESRWNRQKSKMKCTAIYSQWLSDCNRSQCHLSASYLSCNDRPNSWWTNPQTGQCYSTEGCARARGFSPLTGVQSTVTERAPGTWLNPGPAIVMLRLNRCPQRFQLRT